MEELATHKAASPSTDASDPVFLTRHLKGAIRRANKVLEAAGIEPISESVSPHSLRRTYASLRGALRDDPVYIAEQLGHEDPTFTFRVYTKAVKRRQRPSGAYLEAFDRALDWALMGAGAVADTDPRRPQEPAPAPNPAAASGFHGARDLHVSR